MANTMETVVEGTMNETVMDTVPEATKKFGFGKAASVAAALGLGVLVGKKIVKKIKSKKNDKKQSEEDEVVKMIEKLEAKGYFVGKTGTLYSKDDDELFKPLTDDDLKDE